MVPKTQHAPIETVAASAPIRICDTGGWTDTWFAERGHVVNIAVSPRVHVQIEVFRRGRGRPPVVLSVQGGAFRAVDPTASAWEHHPLLQATIAMMGVPGDVSLRIATQSDVPPGASTGTSAAVTVALIAALDHLTPGQIGAGSIAYRAHRVETEWLGWQSGIQDQLAAAYGGISFIDMHAFPHATVAAVEVPSAVREALNQRLVLVYLGNAHNSSQVHEMVIRDLEGAGPDDARLEALRHTALSSRDALVAGDLAAYGRSLSANTAAQADLHPKLVSEDARQVIAIAQQYGAWGWKVNGAGGAGGSLTLMAAEDPAAHHAMVAAVQRANAQFRIIPIALSRSGVESRVQKL